MPLDANTLLSGPRGRRFCLEFVLPDKGRHSSEGRALWYLLFYATYRLDSKRAGAGAIFGPGADKPLPDPSIAELAAALDNMPLITVDDTNIVIGLAAAVNSARYWQEPDGTDELLRAPGLRGALERIAAHIVHSPLTSWWSSAMNSTQWSVQFTDSDLNVPSRLPASEALRLWEAQEIENERTARWQRPVDPTASWSGEWWSRPAWSLTTSTRAREGVGPVGLWLIEDSPGCKRADSYQVGHHSAARVYEISGADSWAELCREYPLRVTATRRHDWYSTTGRDGRWVLPNWYRVSRDFDAVHLSVTAYLTSAGTEIQVDERNASVIAGWNPDETYWLTDVTQDPATRASWTLDYQSERWHSDESRPASDEGPAARHPDNLL